TADESLGMLRDEIARLRQELDAHARLNARLRDAADEFMSAVAHDLKNPIAAIKVNVQGLKLRLQRDADLQPDQIRERLERVERAVEQQLVLLAQARSRIAEDLQLPEPLRRETVDLVQLARDVVNGWQASDHDHLQLHADCP